MAITSSSKLCECDKCGAKAHSMSGTYHRRCTGQPHNGEGEVVIRAKREKLGIEFRGKWN